MSNLNPGGSRSRGPRVFGASAIARACDSNRNIARGADNSIADKPHEHSREVARRLRQEAARAAKESQR
jgi:hypothetical protein